VLYGAAAICIVAIHLATNATLGFQTDELYYLACGRHLAFGYVDFPPLVPLLARLDTGLLGVTPWALRVLPAIVSGVTVVLSGLYVRRLGGSLALQGIALLLALTMPLILGTWLFQTVVFDQLTWMLSLYWFLSLLVTRKARYWVLLGITLGVGLESKDTIVPLIAGMGGAVLAAPSLRTMLRTRYPWYGAALMFVIWAPNIVWQIANGFPSLTYASNHGGSIAGGGGIAAYLGGLILILNLLLPLWIAGMISLFRHREMRPIGIAVAVPLVVFLFVGKYYYPGPTIPIAMAQGLIALSHVDRSRLRAWLSAGVVVATLLASAALLKYALPITPASRLHATGLDSVEVFADTVGWPQITNQVTAIYTSLPTSERNTTDIISSDYGVAGALDIFGNQTILPGVYSPQLSDAFWLPSRVAATDAIMVGYLPSDVTWMCTSATVVAHLTVPYDDASLEQDAPVTFCHLSEPITSAWSRLRNFS
jgi:4-amino-4-deoxy-L-arabinose transferase-like glycosyltransferase